MLKALFKDKKYPAGCSSNFSGNTHYGIMPGHAFSLLEVNEINIDDQIINVAKIFNPYK